MAPSGSKILGNATIWNKKPGAGDASSGIAGEGFVVTSKPYPVEIFDNYLIPALSTYGIDIEQVVFPPIEVETAVEALAVPSMDLYEVSIMGPVKIISSLDTPQLDLYEVRVQGPIAARDSALGIPDLQVTSLAYSVRLTVYLEDNSEDLKEPALTLNEVILNG